MPCIHLPWPGAMSRSSTYHWIKVGSRYLSKLLVVCTALEIMCNVYSFCVMFLFCFVGGCFNDHH
jgi:hypothetical protein